MGLTVNEELAYVIITLKPVNVALCCDLRYQSAIKSLVRWQSEGVIESESLN